MDLITSLKIIRATYPIAKRFMTVKERLQINKDYYKAVRWLKFCGVTLPKELL